MYVVTGVAHAAAVARQLPQVPEDNILVEPEPRDSLAAVALAAAVVARRDPEAVMAVYSADHLIGRQERFEELIGVAARAAETGALVTVGIRPTRPETGFGYLHLAEEIAPGVHRIAEFREKPTRRPPRPTWPPASTCGTPECSSSRPGRSWPSSNGSARSCAPASPPSPTPGTARNRRPCSARSGRAWRRSRWTTA